MVQPLALPLARMVLATLLATCTVTATVAAAGRTELSQEDAWMAAELRSEGDAGQSYMPHGCSDSFQFAV